MGLQTDNDAYAASCREHLIGHVEALTRHGADDLAFGKIDSSQPKFQVDKTVQLVAKADLKQIKGAIAPEGSDDIAGSGSEFQSILKRYAAEEAADRRILDNLHKILRTGGYARLAEGAKFHTHPRRATHTHECEGCGGRGQINCPQCHASGIVSCGCDQGTVTCGTCYGSGTINETRYMNGRNYQYTRYCGCRNGRVTCGTCNGHGVLTCGKCNGEKFVPCDDCAATGRITEVGYVDSHAVSEYSVRLPSPTPPTLEELSDPVRLPQFADYFAATPADSHVEYDAQRAVLTYDVTANLCSIDGRIGGKSHHVRYYGWPPVLHDADCIVETMLEDDCNALVGAVAGAGLSPFIAARVKPAVSKFVESEVNCKLLEIGKSAATVAQGLDNLVSAAYVERSTAALRTAIKRGTNWSLAKTTLLGALAAPLAVIGGSAFLMRNDRFNMAHDQEWLLLNGARATENIGIFALLVLPLAVLLFLAMRFLQRRWTRTAGTAALQRWAEHEKLFSRKRHFVLLWLAGVVAAISLFNAAPMKIDREGRFYGIGPALFTVRVSQPPAQQQYEGRSLRQRAMEDCPSLPQTAQDFKCRRRY